MPPPTSKIAVPVVARAGSSSGRAGRRRPRTRSASSGRRSAARRPRTPCGRWLKTSLTTLGCADPRQVVGADHPLVVLRRRSRAPREALCRRAPTAGSVSTTRLWKRIIARWVCATARFSSLRGSGMIALRFFAAVLPAPRGRSKPSFAGMPAVGERLAHLQVDAVGLVELRRLRVARARRRRASRGRGSASGAWSSCGGETFSPSMTVVLSKVRSWSMNWPR